MKFIATRVVRFADCDPAGIVFFPQYLVMLNTLVEQWFDEGLRIPFASTSARAAPGCRRCAWRSTSPPSAATAIP